MSTSVEDIMRARYDELGKLRQDLLDELVPVEEEWRRLGVALQAMGAVLEDYQSRPPADVVQMPTRPAVAPVERRERHPDVQRAIETQTPSQAIPKGTALFCSEGCTTAHESGGFTDLMALRTHVKRTHDREPTEQEKVPR